MKPTFPLKAWISLLCLCMGLAPLSFAQQPDSETDEEVIVVDTTEISWNRKKLIIVTDEDGKHFRIKKIDKDDDSDYNPDYEPKTRRRVQRSDVDFMALDFGVTNYYVDGTFGSDAAIPELELKTFRPFSHVALHFLPTRVSVIGRGAVNLKTAITIDWNNYNFVNDITLIDNQESLSIDTTGVDFKVNKLIARYAQIPLLLNINTAPGTNDGLSISFGVYAGVLWNARTKQVSDENGKVKINGDFNLNPFRYGLMARIDFRWFDFYATYNLSELFAEGEGPSTQTFTAGVNLIDF